MRKTGKVLSTSGETALVSITRESACSGECENCGGCRGGTVVKTEVLNPIGAKVGDMVLIDMADQVVMLSSVAVYFLPILLGIIGYIAKGLILSGVGFILPYLLLFIFRKRLSDRVRSTIVKVVQ